MSLLDEIRRERRRAAEDALMANLGRMRLGKRNNMDGPDSQFPGMAAAFEAHTGQSWTDLEWQKEAAMWAAAWKAAKTHNVSSTSNDADQNNTDPAQTSMNPS